MYAALLARWFRTTRANVWRATVVRSGLLTVIVLAAVLLGLAFGWHEHIRGRFAQLKGELKKPAVAPIAPTLRPGGQDPIVLERTQIEGGTTPEFLKAVLLPGRGLNLLQITAYLPQKGKVQLLASPSLEDATKLLTGSGTDVNGAGSLSLGGAYEAPWAGRLIGNASTDGKTLSTVWQKNDLTLPAIMHSGGLATSIGGLLLKQSSTQTNTNVMPDGGEAQAVFDAGDFDGHWLSNTEITTTVQLTSHAIEMKITARNTGDRPEPMGLGWHPRFAILNGNRASMRLRIPSDMRAEVKDRRTNQPTGKLLTTTGTEYDFTARNGAPLGTLNLDDTYVHLHQALLDNGPIAEIIDPQNDYGLRITALSSYIKAIHVYAPQDKDFVTVAPRFNYDDPFGREWPTSEDTGMVTLAPGQSIEWRIRLEIFSPSASEPPHL